jgi:hypothetical protein
MMSLSLLLYPSLDGDFGVVSRENLYTETRVIETLTIRSIYRTIPLQQG